MLRAIVPGTFIHQFWHIPFPPPDILRLLPGGMVDSLLRGLLGNDLLAFHTERHARNFLDCVSQFCPDIAVDPRRLCATVDERTMHVAAYPISIDVERYASESCALGISVARIDYTKGIPERLRALDLLWQEAPELRGCLTFLFVATPSRSELAAYKALDDEVLSSVEAINARWGTDDWTPIVLLHQNTGAEELAAIYRAGDLCLI